MTLTIIIRRTTRLYGVSRESHGRKADYGQVGLAENVIPATSIAEDYPRYLWDLGARSRTARLRLFPKS
jgi:hypothetical protein